MPDQNPRDIAALLDIMRTLRNPDGGCPWDVEQSFASIAPYTIEEAYEVAGAIEEENWDGLKDELGDLLFQVVFHAQLAEERGLFDFADVVAGVPAKLERRHPNLSGGLAGMDSAEAQVTAWETPKARGGAGKPDASLLDDVPRALPALARALKLQKRAASV